MYGTTSSRRRQTRSSRLRAGRTRWDRTTATFEDGLIAAVNLGGDADSIGAVYGQLAGAYYGFSAIPRRWVESVKTWKTVDALIESFLDKLDAGRLSSAGRYSLV